MSPRSGAADRSRLKMRDRDVLRGVVRGHSNAEIAKALGLREQTVKNRISVLFQELHVSNRVQLAVLVVRRWPELMDSEQ